MTNRLPDGTVRQQAAEYGIPLAGAEVIGKWLSRFPKLAPAGAVLSLARVNGGPALRMDVDGEGNAVGLF